MSKLFQRVIATMEEALRKLERQVPPPKRVRFRDSFVWRYTEKTAQQALIQKLARGISSLHAINVLIAHGLLQEQGAMHRILDEIHEDISFLAVALTNDTLTPRHIEYLSAFYAEEFDDLVDKSTPYQRPAAVPRKKVRAYTTRVLGNTDDPSAVAATEAKLSSAYSGYIHAASPHTMEMYGGSPPQFQVSGMFGTSLWEGHVEDAWNYFYRSLLSAAIIAKAFGDAELVEKLDKFIFDFEAESGTNFYSGSKPPG